MTTMSLAQTATLVHGYTIADIQSLTRRASAAMRIIAIDETDRRDAAWFGIVEHLYNSEEPPTRNQLLDAGCDAVRATGRANLHHHGVNVTTKQLGPRFATYWNGPRGDISDDGFSERLIERMALPQALSQLTDLEYEAVATVAVMGSVTAAATALGISRPTMNSRIERARRRFKEVWMSPDTPRSYATNPAICRNGHPRDQHGYDYKGSWKCRICDRNNQRRVKARGRA